MYGTLLQLYLHNNAKVILRDQSGIVECVVGEMIRCFVVKVRVIRTPLDELGFDLGLDVSPRAQALGLEDSALISGRHRRVGGSGGEGSRIALPLQIRVF